MTEPQSIRTFRTTALRFALAGLIILAMVTTGSALGAAPAEAASKAYGYEGGSGAGSGWLGNVSTHGVLAYCVDEAGLFPSGTTSSNGYIGSISATSASSNPGHNGTAAVSGSAMQKLNYALSKYGQAATSNRKAAALEAYVYSVTSSLYPGNAIEKVVKIRVTDPGEASAVISSYLSIQADVNAHYAAPLQKNSASLSIAMDPVPALTGTVSVSVTPSSATGSLTLTNAVITATGSTTIAVSDGDVIPITATRLTGNDLYSVQADATFTAPTTYARDVHEYTTSSPNEAQRVVTGGQVTGATFTASAVDFDPVAPQFEPIVTTAVTQTSVDPGDPVDDRLIAHVGDSAHPWIKNTAGMFDQVVARGMLYCAIDSYPVLGESPPHDAIVEGPDFVTLSGPGTYTTDGSYACPGAGYAMWVWSILASDQSPSTAFDMSAGYDWTDETGEPAETSFVRASIAATTHASDETVGLHEPTSDVVTVSQLDGEWPSDQHGGAAEVEFDGIAYWVAGDVAPERSGSIPTDAIEFATATITATAAGNYNGPAVVAPYDQDGFVIWDWNTPGGDYAKPWSEEFADANQVVQVLAPTVTSSANPTVALSDTAVDVVTVSEPPMGQVAELTWLAYLRPPGTRPVCDDTTVVFDSSGSPVEVSAPGTYTVPDPPEFKIAGTYLWVAVLSAADGSVIERGTCGDPAESTTVVPMSLVTSATQVAADRGLASDSATISGLVPSGANIRFVAYRQTSPNPACEVGEAAYVSPLIPMNRLRRIDSPSVALQRGRYFWVATAYDREGNALASHACGVASEGTRVLGVLAYTGQEFSWVPLLLGFSMLLAGITIALLRRSSRTTARGQASRSMRR